MSIEIKKEEGNAKKPFVKPELKILDIKNTQTGTTPDPNEFNPFLNMSRFGLRVLVSLLLARSHKFNNLLDNDQ